jgi:hypothetical protein
MDQSEALHTFAVTPIAAAGRVPLDALGAAANWSRRDFT